MSTPSVVSNVSGSVTDLPVRPSTSKRLMPPPPPVNVSNLRTIAGVATATAKVASARYSPASRSAGKPKRNPIAPATSPASGIVQMSRMSFVNWWPKSSSGVSWFEIRIAVV